VAAGAAVPGEDAEPEFAEAELAEAVPAAEPAPGDDAELRIVFSAAA
jgi:hypothetical protein